MKTYYAKSSGGFYLDEVHGARRITIADPAWQRPLLPDGKPDREAIAPQIEVDNPDCKIPVDAVEITDAEYAALLAGQSTGQCITADVAGRPMLTAPAPTPFAVQKAAELASFKELRERFVNRMAGVWTEFAAQKTVAGDLAAANVMSIRQGLKGMLSEPAIKNAADIVTLRAALKARYKALTSVAPKGIALPEVLAAYRELDA